MKTKNNMASTAKERAKKAIIVSMASITSLSVQQTSDAARAAIMDMKSDMGPDATALAYTWDPFDGMLA